MGETGKLFVGNDVCPTLAPVGDALIHATYAKPGGSAAAVKILHHTAICLARKRIWIQNPYFIPQPKAIDAFGDAVKRGVDVLYAPRNSQTVPAGLRRAGAHRHVDSVVR